MIRATLRAYAAEFGEGGLKDELRFGFLAGLLCVAGGWVLFVMLPGGN